MVPDENTGARTTAPAAEAAKLPVVEDPQIIKLEEKVEVLTEALKKQKEANTGLRTQIKNLKQKPKGRAIIEHK